MKFLAFMPTRHVLLASAYPTQINGVDAFCAKHARGARCIAHRRLGENSAAQSRRSKGQGRRMAPRRYLARTSHHGHGPRRAQAFDPPGAGRKAYQGIRLRPASCAPRAWNARRGRAPGRDPKGGALRPTECVKPLARCPRIALRGFPAL